MCREVQYLGQACAWGVSHSVLLTTKRMSTTDQSITMVSSSVAAGDATQLNAITPNIPDSMSPVVKDQARSAHIVTDVGCLQPTQHCRWTGVRRKERHEARVLPMGYPRHDVLCHVRENFVKCFWLLRGFLGQGSLGLNNRRQDKLAASPPQAPPPLLTCKYPGLTAHIHTHTHQLRKRAACHLSAWPTLRPNWMLLNTGVIVANEIHHLLALGAKVLPVHRRLASRSTTTCRTISATPHRFVCGHTAKRPTRRRHAARQPCRR